MIQSSPLIARALVAESPEYDSEMTRRSVDEPAVPVTIDLSRSHLERLDRLRAERNLTRGQLIACLLDQVKDHRKGRRISRPAFPERQPPNPWAQPWPWLSRLRMRPRRAAR